MAALALELPHLNLHAGWLHGLLVVAVAVVASAILTMQRSLAPDITRLAIAVAVLALVLFVPAGVIDPLAIALAALAGVALLRGRVKTASATLDLGVSRRAGAAALVLFALAFVALGMWSASGSPGGGLANTLFRVGALVFGGGHVVLPLLQTQVAQAGIVDSQTVLAGYASAQAMPGPLFTIASYVGASAYGRSLGWSGALLGTVAIFAPSFFLIPGVAPFYRMLGESSGFRAALAGANAGVVGLLAAAFVTPIVPSAIHTWVDALVAVAAFAALYFAKAPAWAIVIASALIGALVL
jgi:chromate transporter